MDTPAAPKLDLDELVPRRPGGGTNDPFKILNRPASAYQPRMALGLRQTGADGAPSPDPAGPGGPSHTATHPALPPVRMGDGWQGPVSLSIQPDITAIEELTAEQLAALPTKPSGHNLGGVVTSVTNLRARHHEIARLMAAGKKDSEIAEILDASMSTLASLRRSPTFQELLFHYMSMRDAEALNLFDRISVAAGLALDRLTDKLQQPHEVIDGEFLRKASVDLLDRAGYSPVAKSANVTLPLSAADLRSLREENRAARARNITPSSVVPPDHKGVEISPSGEPGASAVPSEG